MKVLVTGFEPFGGDAINPSREIALSLPRAVGGMQVSTAVLPVVYYASLAMLRRLVALNNPDVVICLGLAGGRPSLSFETRAVNLNEARIPDNDGQRPHSEPVHRGRPAALPPSLPLRHIARRLRRAGVPLELSRSAGTFLCNHIFYGLMDYVHAEDPSVLGGFIHVPFIEEQRAAHPGTSVAVLEDLVRGMRETIAAMDE